MPRPLASLVVLLGCALLLPAVVSLSREPRTAAPRAAARACRPQPPVQVALEQTAADAAGVVTLSFAITPREDAGALDWRLALPEGAELVEGAATGRLPAGGATGPLVARVRLPDG